MSERPGTAAFLRRNWRKRPAHFPAYVPARTHRGVDVDRFRSWCAHPVRARIYARTESVVPGSATARNLSPRDGLAIYEHFAARGEPVTLVLNGIDAYDALIRGLQDGFAIPYDWRLAETVATLSSESGSIGFHAGVEDGFVVQLRGARHWRVWAPSAAPARYRRELCGQPTESEAPLARARGTPLLSRTLCAGDALYIPALFPHEGITLKESISLSVAWQGISAFNALATLAAAVPRDALLAAAHRHRLFRLLEDPPPGRDAGRFLEREMCTAFAPLPARIRPGPRRVSDFARALVEVGLRRFEDQ